MSESRILILTQSDQYHPLENLGEMMVSWLKDAGIEDLTLTSDRSVIAGDMSEYNLLILAMTPGELSPTEEEALVSFVAGGKKIMAIHSATVVGEANLEYTEMVGGRFTHHSPYHEFTVKVADPGHPVVKGLMDFKITDELYVLDRAPSASSVLLTAFWEDNAQPMLYLRAYGQGKVLYNAMGHDMAAYENPNFRKITVQGVKWLLR